MHGGGVCADVAAIALDRRRYVWWRRVWRWRVCVCVCVFCFASLQARALEVSRDRATHSSDCARLTAVCGGGGGGCGGAVCGGGARVCVCVVFS